MKAKKAIKRLDKVEAILSDVIDRYATTGSETREFLDAARVSIFRAKAGVDKNPELASRKQVSPKGEKAKQTAAKQKEKKPSTKKFSGVKRKGVHTETAQRLSDTQEAAGKTA